MSGLTLITPRGPVTLIGVMSHPHAVVTSTSGPNTGPSCSVRHNQKDLTLLHVSLTAAKNAIKNIRHCGHWRRVWLRNQNDSFFWGNGKGKPRVIFPLLLVPSRDSSHSMSLSLWPLGALKLGQGSIQVSAIIVFHKRELGGQKVH